MFVVAHLLNLRCFQFYMGHNRDFQVTCRLQLSFFQLHVGCNHDFFGRTCVATEIFLSCVGRN
jgi:hypothetical protein